MTTTQHEKPPPTAHWQTVVAEAVGGLRYGVVQIVVHDGAVVQVERTEKWRLDKPPTR